MLSLMDGRFRLEARIGHGRFADIWRGRDRPGELAGGKPLAFKLFRHPTDPEGSHAAFCHELLASRVLPRDPAIVTPLACFTNRIEGGTVPVIVLPLMAHLNLAQWLDVRAGRVAAEAHKRLGLVDAIARALAILEGQDIAHGDLGFGNILVGEGVVRLIDFGSAHFAGAPPVTPRRHVSAFYPDGAPPAGSAEAIGDDVYAFAVLAYLILTERHPLTEDWVPLLHGRLPAGGTDPHTTGRVTPLTRLSPWLTQRREAAGVEALLRTCLIKDRQHRPSFAEIVRSWPKPQQD